MGFVPCLLEAGLAQVLDPLKVPLLWREGLDQGLVPERLEQGSDQEMVLVWVALLWEVVLDPVWGAE